MKKRLVVLLAMAMTMVFVTACNGSEANTEAGKEPATTEAASTEDAAPEVDYTVLSEVYTKTQTVHFASASGMLDVDLTAYTTEAGDVVYIEFEAFGEGQVVVAKVVDGAYSELVYDKSGFMGTDAPDMVAALDPAAWTAR